LNFHFLTAADNGAFTGLGAEHFRAADLTFISFTQLVHDAVSLVMSPKPCLVGYFFSSIGCPQQVSVPSPPLVTTNSAPHF